MARNWTVDLSEAALADQIAQAKAAAEAAEAVGPSARAVRYDAGRNLIEFSLTSGAFFAVPRDLIQGLRGATAEQLEDVWLDRAGLSVHWPSLDADFSILGLIQGIFGTKAWMAEINAQGLKQIEWYKEHDHPSSAKLSPGFVDTIALKKDRKKYPTPIRLNQSELPKPIIVQKPLLPPRKTRRKGSRKTRSLS